MYLDESYTNNEDRNTIIRQIIKKAMKELPEPRNDYDIDIPDIESIKEKLNEDEQKNSTMNIANTKFVKKNLDLDEILEQKDLTRLKQKSKKDTLQSLSVQNA